MRFLVHVAGQGLRFQRSATAAPVWLKASFGDCHVVVKLLGIGLNWRSYLSNLPSAVTGKGEEEWAGAMAYLREPAV
jgi:hypothetical protein